MNYSSISLLKQLLANSWRKTKKYLSMTLMNMSRSNYLKSKLSMHTVLQLDCSICNFLMSKSKPVCIRLKAISNTRELSQPKTIRKMLIWTLTLLTKLKILKNKLLRKKFKLNSVKLKIGKSPRSLGL